MQKTDKKLLPYTSPSVVDMRVYVEIFSTTVQVLVYLPKRVTHVYIWQQALPTQIFFLQLFKQVCEEAP